MTTTTQSPVTNTTPVAQINDVVLKLDQLYGAYNAILEQAKAQLENLELSEEHIDKLVRRLREDRELQNSVAYRMLDVFRRELQDQDGHWFSERVSGSVFRRIEESASDISRQQARDYFFTDNGKSDIRYAIRNVLDDEDNPFTSYVRVRLRGVISTLFTSDDIRDALGITPSNQQEAG